ncbi:membrane protein [Clostridium botulinum]|uniref:Membrane protein n=2 Tax=Clostridium botulinum TaxID=1491 RepID=A0A9Q1UYQ6_CLOBO|nr:FtsX-like permease family protein [Clostridium botulinum]AEB75381.1 lipoprotein releasing system transmembrane protein, putative [Clostridium botulinum BKT015925]KEH98647.1 membrane protein [Clostridium botulinum C/D str. Sp77]KOA73566.1 membrane protein [Clostridium botulinum]KOA83141.1 membrane protein [Clostridium botulinum]KOA88042.1 membrane protein [Clostridium botulinum]
MLTSMKVAWRFLMKRKIQSIVIVLSIAIAVSVQIFIGLLSKGLERTLLFKIVGNAPHITVYAKGGAIHDWKEKIDKLKLQNIKTIAVVPNVDTQGYAKLKDITEPIVIRGFVPQDASKMYKIKDKIYEGKLFKNDNEVILGSDLKERLGVSLGDKINIVTPWGKSKEFVITGFFDLGNIKLNKSWVMGTLTAAQDFSDLKKHNKIRSIEISIKNAYDVGSESKNIQKLLNDKNLKVENWKEQNKLIVSGLMGQKVCTIIIQFFVLLASSLSIVSVLSISVVQKYKEIGILKAMGMKGRKTALIFFFQALFIGVLGTLIGVALSMLYIKGFNRYILTDEGIPLVNIIISREFILKSSILSLLSSVFASIFPSIKSYKLNPVEVIKNG